jgi:hypothetical protein
MSEIIDLRVFADINNRQKVYIKTQDTGENIRDCSASMAAVMVASFLTGKKCFWDRTRFATVEQLPVVGEDRDDAAEIEIRTWEASVDPTANQVDFYLGLSAHGLLPSSGLPEKVIWRHVSVPVERAPLIMALLQSKYAQLRPGVISNSDIGNLDRD